MSQAIHVTSTIANYYNIYRKGRALLAESPSHSLTQSSALDARLKWMSGLTKSP